VRYYVDPRKHVDYRSVVAAHGEPSGDRPIAWCDFRSPEVDTIGGCHVYHLTHELLAAGYEPVFRRNFRFLASVPTKPYKRLLVDTPFATAKLTPAEAVLAITDDPETPYDPDTFRVVHVDYAERPAGPDELALPFCMGPRVIDVSAVPEIDPAAPRPVGVFFAGSTAPRDYDRDVLRSRYGLMTRLEMLDVVFRESSLPEPLLLRTPADAERLHTGCSIALGLDGGLRVEHRDWLPTLALADFWLACPGTQMPMCHNLVEALSVGTVPILEYDRYTTPPLEDGVNCLAFRGERGLVDALRHALTMPEHQKRRLRLAARDFYERHHAPGALVERLMNASANPVTLLMNDHRAARPIDEPALRVLPIGDEAPAARAA